MATSSDTMRGLRLFQSQVWTPLLVALGIGAFCLAGFAFTNSAAPSTLIYQPAPIYVYLALLFFTLQGTALRRETGGRIAYIFVTSGVALAVIGLVSFTPDSPAPVVNAILGSPYTFPFLNGLLLGVFFFDAVTRRLHHDLEQVFKVDATGATRPFPLFWVALASDAAGLAILSAVIALVFFLLGSIPIPQPFAVGPSPSTVSLHLRFQPNSHFILSVLGVPLWQLNFALMILALIGLGFSADVSYLNMRRSLWATQFRRIRGEAWTQIRYSLRLVLSPIAWVFAAFTIAAFSYFVALSLAVNAHDHSGSMPPDLLAMLNLINPLRNPVFNYSLVFADVALGIVAVTFTLLAVAIVEPDNAVFRRAARIIADAIRRLVVVLAWFLLVLVAINGFPMVFANQVPEPFQFGAPGSIVVAAIVIPLVVQWIRRRRRPPGS